MMTITQAPEWSTESERLLESSLDVEPALQTAIALHSIRQKLTVAQQYLQDCHSPFQLAVLTYLRLIGLAMQTAQRANLRELLPIPSKTPYLSVLGQLIAQSPDWWQQCDVSEEGYLTSSDCTLQMLIQPFNTFVQQALNLIQEG
jgi:hypothetical protein